MLARYRRTGADPPFGDPAAYHGVAMEGSFWRVTDAATGTVLVAFVAVNRDRAGERWATVGLAVHPHGLVRSAALADVCVAADGLVVRDGEREVLRADARSLAVDLGRDACVGVELERVVQWPRRAFGGLGPAQMLPGLSQYWHPWLLHAGARVEGRVGDRALALAGARAYAEKSWGRDGFPGQWWWGQAHDFGDDGGVCVAFAGGRAGALGLRLLGTSVVIRAGRHVVRLTRPPGLVRVAARDGTWRLSGRTARHAVELEGHANGNDAYLLPVPIPAERRNDAAVAAQHLAGELRVVLRQGRRTLYAGTSALAGLELGGPPTAARRGASRG